MSPEADHPRGRVDFGIAATIGLRAFGMVLLKYQFAEPRLRVGQGIEMRPE